MKWIFLLFAGSIIHKGSSNSSLPTVSVYPCNVPVADRQFSVCCKTENIYTSHISIYKDTTDNVIIEVDHPCRVTSAKGVTAWKCQADGDTTIFTVNTSRNASESVGVWGCKYYGGRSTYNITTNKVVTHDSGYQYAKLHGDITLIWTIQTEDYEVFLPNGQPLKSSDLNYTIELKSLKLEVTLKNVTLETNGTYICASKHNNRKDALTVIVMKSPLEPSISSVDTKFSGQYMTVTFKCNSNSLSAGPLYYTPDLNVSWLYSNTAGYTVNEHGKGLIVSNLDCDIKHSRPVFCALRERPGEWTSNKYVHPHTLCYLKPTSAPSCSNSIDKDAQTAGIVIASVFIAITIVIFVIYFYFRYECFRDYFSSCCESCGESCEKLSGFCKNKCCGRCRKDDDELEEPPNVDIPSRLRRTPRANNNDLQHILNLYDVDMEPTITSPQQGTNTTDNGDVDTGNRDEVQDNSEGNPTGSVETIDIVLQEVGTSMAAATGTNQSALVVELEMCLKNLSNLVNSSENQVQVRRSHIVEDMMNIYTDPDILRSHLNVKLVGENGSDWGGVSRDVFTTFWNEVTSALFQGDTVHVPYLPLINMENENKFIILGRILTHSTAILGFLPVLISKSVMMVIIYNSTEIEETSLLDDFLLYVDDKDRRLIKGAIEDFSTLTEEQVNDIQEMFFRYDMGCLLRSDSFRSHLLKIARNELCVKPRALCEKIRQGIPEDHFDRFWCHLTVDHIDLLHARLKPSAEKILERLQPAAAFGNLTRRRRKVYEFFQEFIEKLSGEDLQLLLQLITGQSCVPKRTIQVDFSNLEGAQRRPIFHTCGYMVELPDTYRNYKEFEKEMNNIIHSDILHFDMA